MELKRSHGSLGGVSLWWVLALADMRMRSERFEYIRRTLDDERRFRLSRGEGDSEAVVVAATGDELETAPLPPARRRQQTCPPLLASVQPPQRWPTGRTYATRATRRNRLRSP